MQNFENCGMKNHVSQSIIMVKLGESENFWWVAKSIARVRYQNITMLILVYWFLMPKYVCLVGWESTTVECKIKKWSDEPRDRTTNTSNWSQSKWGNSQYHTDSESSSLGDEYEELCRLTWVICQSESVDFPVEPVCLWVVKVLSWISRLPKIVLGRWVRSDRIFNIWREKSK